MGVYVDDLLIAISKMMSDFQMMLGCKPQEYTSTLEKVDHPEIDTTAEVDGKG
jgi:hypothetical protein